MGFVSAGRNQGTKFYFELPLYNASSAGPIVDAASNLRSNPFSNSFQPASQRYTPAAANTASRLFENGLVLEDCRVDAPVTLKPTYQRQATNPSGGR